MTREEHAKLERERAYKERIGKVYNDFRVVGIEWDAEKKRQVWTVSCVRCGKTRVTSAWHSYTSGKVGKCKCKEDK